MCLPRQRYRPLQGRSEPRRNAGFRVLWLKVAFFRLDPSQSRRTAYSREQNPASFFHAVAPAFGALPIHSTANRERAVADNHPRGLSFQSGPSRAFLAIWIQTPFHARIALARSQGSAGLEGFTGEPSGGLASDGLGCSMGWGFLGRNRLWSQVPRFILFSPFGLVRFLGGLLLHYTPLQAPIPFRCPRYCVPHAPFPLRRAGHGCPASPAR